MNSSSIFRSRGGLHKPDSCTVHSSVLLPKALAPRIFRRKGWHRGTLMTWAIRFYPHRHHEEQHQQVDSLQCCPACRAFIFCRRRVPNGRGMKCWLSDLAEMPDVSGMHFWCSLTGILCLGLKSCRTATFNTAALGALLTSPLLLHRSSNLLNQHLRRDRQEWVWHCCWEQAYCLLQPGTSSPAGAHLSPSTCLEQVLLVEFMSAVPGAAYLPCKSAPCHSSHLWGTQSRLPYASTLCPGSRDSLKTFNSISVTVSVMCSNGVIPLPCRGTAEAQRERQAALNRVAQEAAQGEGGPWGTQQESSEKEEGARVTGQEIQSRIQQVKAAIEAARAANRPDILRNEVAHLPLHSYSIYQSNRA